MAWVYERQEENGKFIPGRTWKTEEQKEAQSYFTWMKGRGWSCRLKLNGRITRSYNAQTGEVIISEATPDYYLKNPGIHRQGKVQRAGRATGFLRR
jgi:hypothetical protein